jgi:phenylpyruvate tautomerase PptA (4-oxalocrotonate tautomerase family)
VVAFSIILIATWYKFVSRPVFRNQASAVKMGTLLISYIGGFMPHLQFELNRSLTDTQKITLAEQVRKLFSDVMDTGTDHISISIREFGIYNLSIGRVKEPEKGVAVVNADIREGRTMEQRRALTLGFMEILNKNLNIPKSHMYVSLTEHKGEDFHLFEKYLASWQTGEDPLAD